MNHHNNPSTVFISLFLLIFIISCNNNTASPEKENIVKNPEKIDTKTSENIKLALKSAMENFGKVDDSIQLSLPSMVNAFYNTNDFSNVWSKKEKWEPMADSLFQFIQQAELSGLFPKDYHYKHLQSLKSTLDGDSVKRMNSALWTNADLMLTDGLLHILQDLKIGRLRSDSISLNVDSSFDNSYIAGLKNMLENKNFSATIQSFEPQHTGYVALKNGIKRFVDSMDRHVYTYVTYPYKAKDVVDSLLFIKTFQRRLKESNCIDFTDKLPDSLQLNTSVKKYQKLKGLKQDGIVSSSLIKVMNNTDVEKFKRIAITLDRYKQLPSKMPEKYIWVNLPGYYLEVWDHDTLALQSKVICGKPGTRTPLLNSHITDMITYPTWTIPNSIIVKKLLPKLKNNSGYISRLGYKLVNGKGETISPSSVNWEKYSKGIPYKIMQGSGDDNALGIFKFNFSNKYDVYLHDTNERYLFKNSSRALSHGCVRVQEWEKLANYIATNDSLNLKAGDSLSYNTDSIKNWIAAKKNKRMLVKDRIELYIRYFTCEGKDGKIKFYDDMYGEDKVLREKYFNDK